MEINRSISLSDRINFVARVKELCVVDGVVNYSLFDYALRLMVYCYFVRDNKVDELSESEITALIYSKEFNNAFMNEADEELSAVIDGLAYACEKELDMEFEKYMVSYNAVYNPDPLNRIVDIIDELKDNIEPLMNEEFVVGVIEDMYKKRQQEAKKSLRKKPLKAVKGGK